MIDWPILSLLIWLPILAGVSLLLVGERAAVRPIALGFAVLIFVLSLPLYFYYDASSGLMQFLESSPWINAFGITVRYELGVDGISIPLILLNTFMTVIVVIAGWQSVHMRVGEYMAAFLIMEGLVNGVFMALDAILFYVFFEGMLIPMFLVIGIWGGPRRVYATMKFFLYTFLGSVFLLVSLVYLYLQSNSFYLPDLYMLDALPSTVGSLIFFSFLFAFGVKIPMWPVHTWLPDAHVEAPTGGSVILAAITLKVGGYAFLRLALPIVPEAAAQWSWLVVALSLIAVIYIGLVALVQSDMKKLVAYSSIAHMGFVTLAFFLVFKLQNSATDLASTGASMAVQGGMAQMISHGFISAALFLAIGVLYDRMHTRDIKAYGGVINRMPIFAAFFILFAMANTGLPGTSGFVGEFFIILASAKAYFWVAVAAATTLIISASYMLWLVKRVILGDVANGEVDKLTDLTRREMFVLSILAIAVLWMGVWPDPLTSFMNASIQQWMEQVAPIHLALPQAGG